MKNKQLMTILTTVGISILVGYFIVSAWMRSTSINGVPIADAIGGGNAANQRKGVRRVQ